MAKQFDQLSNDFIEFINKQHIFFVGTAAKEGRVNISPKGMDTFKVLDPNRVIWLNLTGSGNETAAHLLQNNRITIMFCAFEGKPLILRLYGTTKIHHKGDSIWEEHIDSFPNKAGARQIMEIKVDMVQTSCGFGVPLMNYQEDRDILTKWADTKGEAGIENYQQTRNTLSIDGYATDISEPS